MSLEHKVWLLFSFSLLLNIITYTTHNHVTEFVLFPGLPPNVADNRGRLSLILIALIDSEA